MRLEHAKIPGFPSVDAKKIQRYLQNDIDDDWFQDPIRYSDYISLEKEIDVLTSNAQTNLGKYKPIKRDLFFIPKSNFTLRYSLETDYYERWLYFYLILPLIDKFDILLPRQVYSHRLNNIDSRYLFYNGIQQWEKFEGIVRTRSVGKVVVLADVQNYYENISIEKLRNYLERCLKETAVDLAEMKEMLESITCLISCLEEWSYDNKRGIPQNRDCSSFLANIYMLDIDKLMLSKGYEYYRYMDDIKIICDNKFLARKALKDLVNSLRDKHLSLNSKKTKITEPVSEDHAKISIPNFSLKSIDLLLRTKRKANVAIGYSLLKDMMHNLIVKNLFDTREFRFCITRMSKLARCCEYKIPTGYFDTITEGIIESIIACPTSTDRAVEFLSSVKLNNVQHKKIADYLLDSNKAIYEWQNYWLWKLLILQKYNQDFMREYAIKITSSCNNTDAEKAGALLYLATFGDKDSFIKIRDNFSSSHAIFLQRHELFVIKNLDWIKHLQSLAPSINCRLSGSLRRMKESARIVVMPPPPTRIRDLLETVHQYD
jgi:hypothetical protein